MAERKLHHTSVVPRDFSFQLLEDITDGFSKEHKVGSGGYGDVYKGVLHDGEVIAVKKLNPMMLALDDELFEKEFNNLMRVQHQNIVRLLGYCYETKHIHIEIDGQFHLAKITNRALCFEYLQHGSLDKHLYDESCGLDWCTRYKIIKGICEGLNYLHGGLNKPVFHLDLKPSNILLDKNMVPKIADFGLSRFLLETKSDILTETMKGTVAYMPPEYLAQRQISKEYDIFSLGIIIIQIITGPEGHSKYLKGSPQEFIDLVHNKWGNRIQTTSMYTEEYCQQVKRCIEIAINCLEIERKKRPKIGDIIYDLTQTESVIHEVSMPFSEEFKSTSLLQEGRGGGEEKK
ncbi:putative serine/threonine-protein kinase, partial [Phragmites australis]|uniref:putative serine/threonine-protein kinase n=1 Tax=Phragmites australis TaxID=29695 RepID=UPI002D769036